MMFKKYMIPLFALLVFIGCKKETAYKGNIFPGVTGSGSEATWVVYSHTFTDVPYITSYVATLVPAITFSKYDSSYLLARQKEVTAYSYKFINNGEVGIIGKSPANENIWIRQSNLKWELKDDQVYIYKNMSGIWINTMIGFKDVDKLQFKFKKTYFGDSSPDKERFVMEVTYSIFK